MNFLKKEELEQLDEAALVEALQQLADETGAQIEVTDDSDLVQLYLGNVPEEKPKPAARTRGGKKVMVTPVKDTIRFKDDDGKTRQIAKGQPGEVGPKVAKQLKEEGLVK